MAARRKICIDLSDEAVDLVYEEYIAEQKILKLKLKQARRKRLLVYHKDRAFDGVASQGAPGWIPNCPIVAERRRKHFEKQALNLVMARRLAQVRKVRRNMQAKRDGGM